MKKLILKLFFLISNNFILLSSTSDIEQVIQQQNYTDTIVYYLNKSSEVQVASEGADFEMRVLHETGKPSGATAVFKIVKREGALQVESYIITSKIKLISAGKRRSLGLFEGISTEEKLALRDVFTSCILKHQESFSSNNGCIKFSEILNCTTILPIQN